MTPAAQATNLNYWRTLVPWLSIGEKSKANQILSTIPNDSLSEVESSLLSSGYFTLPNMFDPKLCDDIARAIACIKSHGWHEVWIFMFDEAWGLLRNTKIFDLVARVLGPDFRQLPDFWALHVEKSERGFMPHADASTIAPVNVDGRPNAITVWIPLCDVSVDESCIYLLPADLRSEQDYPFGNGFLSHRQLVTEIIHRVRAVPLSTGGIAGWNHGIFHWGSQASHRAKGPRVSISTEFIRGDIQYDDHEHVRHARKHIKEEHVLRDFCQKEAFPAVENRVILIAKQIIGYTAHARVVNGASDMANQILKV